MWGNLLSFSVPGGTEKISGLWFARGISTQTNTIGSYLFDVSMGVYNGKKVCKLIGIFY